MSHVPCKQLVFIDPIQVGPPGSIVAKRGWMAKQNEPSLCTSDGDVQAAIVGKETNFASVIGPDG